MGSLKVLAVNGSPRRGGNTEKAIERAAAELEKFDIRTEICQIGGQTVPGCKACGWCSENTVGKCVQDGDPVNGIINKIVDADGVILASPVYFAAMTPEVKALIDRVGFVCRMNGGLLKRKVGAAIAVARRAGAVAAFDSINHFFLINEMIVPGSSYWNVAYGLMPGDALDDEEGMDTMCDLGANMGWLMRKIHG